MSDNEDDMLEFEDENYDDDAMEEENVSEDEEDNFDEDEEDEDEEDMDAELVEDEDENVTQITLKKPVKEQVLIGTNTANVLRKINADMLAKVPRVTADSFRLSYLSEKQKAEISVCIISSSKTNDMFGTIYDPQMGPIRVGNPCLTCHAMVDNCPGHYGRIILPAPIIHPLATNVVLLILKSVCHECAKILISKEEFDAKQFYKYSGLARLAQIAKDTESTSSKVTCTYVVKGKCEDCDSNEACFNTKNENPKYCAEHKKSGMVDVTKLCGVVQRKYPKKPNDNKIQYVTNQDNTMKHNTLTANEIYTIFNNISEEDARMLGFSEDMHPRNFIVHSILVPPNCVRPRIEDATSSNGDWVDGNDTEYKTILNNIKDFEKRDVDKTEKMDKIWSAYKQLLDGDASAKGGKQNLSMKARFKGKTGLISNISGKRGEQAARSVITGNDWIGFGMVGVPEYIRQKLTVPVMVANFNKDFLQQLLRQGEVLYIVRKNGKTAGKRLIIDETIRREYILQVGDIVRRMIRNGDVVFFGRQPSLSVGSLMAMRVIIIKANTFQFALSSTKSYSADFDGSVGWNSISSTRSCQQGA